MNLYPLWMRMRRIVVVSLVVVDGDLEGSN
jgi:hypothetical protein